MARHDNHMKKQERKKSGGDANSKPSRLVESFPIIIIIVVIIVLIAGTIVAAALGVSLAAARAGRFSRGTESFTHMLQASTPFVDLWTTVPSKHVFGDTEPPEGVGDVRIKVYCAGNEYEPFVLIVRPSASQNWIVDVGTLPAGVEVETSRVGTIRLDAATDNMNECESLPCDYPDVIWPVQAGTETVNFPSDQNTVLWFTVRVLPDAGLGGQDIDFDVMVGTFSISVRLHVFDFDLPRELSVKSQMNFGFNDVLTRYSVSGTDDDYWRYVNMIKGFWLAHRMSPKGPTWPGGLTGGGTGGACFIDYDCSTRTLDDLHGVWGFDLLAQQAFIDGNDMLEGSTAVFPSFMFAGMRNNDPSQDQRPDSICTPPVTRNAGDWLGSETTPFNVAWGNYMNDLQEYLRDFGLLERSYYYPWNEPQDQADYDAVAWHAQYMKNVAPDVRLMVSEEARPEIYANPTYPNAKIDIWLPVLDNFDPEISFARKRYCNEETWVYFLHGTVPPWLNPITLDHPGIENRLLGWLLWRYRIEGIAYYSMNWWGNNPFTDPEEYGHNGNRFMIYPPTEDGSNLPFGANGHRMVPSMRFELLRDSLEDFEYLRLVNDGNLPAVQTQGTEADVLTSRLILGLRSYMRDDEYLYNLRRLIGLYVGGEAGWGAVPDLEPNPPHSRCEGDPGSYYLNFQDPAGEPSADPLIVNSHTWQKIGWIPFSTDLGYGWFGELDWTLETFLSGAPNDLQNSVIYCDYGRPKTFVFFVPNGEYSVTVSVGWQGSSNYDHQKIFVNSVPFVDDENSDGGYLVRSNTICVTDFTISMDMGIWNEYTMLNYLSIEATGSGCSAPGYAPVEFTQPTDVSCSM